MSGSGTRADVLIVTALKDELDAILEIEIEGEGRSSWQDARDQSDFPYHVRDIPNAYGQVVTVAAAWAGDMGTGAATARAVGLIKELEPSCIAMCGICAGWRKKVFLGDVIVADQVFSYDIGKRVAPGGEQTAEFFHDITTYNLEARWKMGAAYFAQKFQENPLLQTQRPRSRESQMRWLLRTLDAHERLGKPSPVDHPDRETRCSGWTEHIQVLRQGGLISDALGELKLTEKGRREVAEVNLLYPNKEDSDPAFRVHVGAIATGSAVQEDPQLFPRLSRQVRKVLGAELEARAIGFVAEHLGRRRAIIVKAVSDYADAEKDDTYRSFACHASAAVLLAFLQAHPLADADPTVIHSPQGSLDKRHDEFLAHVERACSLHHPEGTKIIRQPGPVPFRTYLEVQVTENQFVRVFPVVALEQPITPELLRSFLGGIHADYQNMNPAVISTLVHAGPPAPPELAQKAYARQVRLISFAEYQGLFDFSTYLQRQTAQLQKSAIYPPEIYVDQRALVSVGGQEATQTEDVLQTLREMLDSPHPRFALVLGDFGTGKTFLLHELARRMALEKAALVPVLIEMHSLQKHRSLKALLAQHFAAADVGRLGPDQFLYMLQEGRIALLFDGFDELALRVTYDRVMEHFSTLIEAAQGQAKVIVTSRTQHFLTDQDIKRELARRAEVLPGYRLIKLERFNGEQVRRFLTKRLGSDSAALERMALLRDVKDLLGLSENPRLLSFIAELKPKALQDARDGSGEVTSASLYEFLIGRWLKGEHARVTPSGAPRGLSLEQLRNGATELAMLLWERTELSVTMKELPPGLFAAMDLQGEHALDREVLRHQLASGSLLVRDEEGRFSFIHPSILEWLVADAAARAVRAKKETAILGRREMSDLMADFFIALAGTEVARAWAEEKANQTETDVIQSNALRVSQRLRAKQSVPDTVFEVTGVRNLQGSKLRGQDLSRADLRGANLTGANLTGTTLAQADLSEAQLSGANLARANLDRAVLQGADLTRADLSGASLLKADLRGARFQGATLRAAKLVGAEVSSLEGAELFGAAMPDPARITPNLAFTAPIQAMAFSPAGDLVATAHVGGMIQLWDAKTGQPLRILEGQTDFVLDLTFDPDGVTLAAGAEDGKVILWRVDQAEPSDILQKHSGHVRSVAFSRDGKMLASGADDGKVVLWSVERMEPLHIFQLHTGAISSVIFTPEGKTQAASSDSESILLWRNIEQAGPLLIPRAAGYILSMAFSRNGKLLATGAEDGKIVLWSVERAESLRTFKSDSGQVRSIAFSRDGRMMATGFDGGKVMLWGVDRTEPRHTFQGPMGGIRSVTFAPDGRTLVVGSEDGKIFFWDVEQARHASVLQGQQSVARNVALSQDGQLLACSSDDGKVLLWNIERTRLLSTLQEYTGAVLCMALSPDGRLLASGTNDGKVILWSVEQGKRLRVLEGHSGAVHCVAFSPDGRLLASGSDDRMVLVRSTERADFSFVLQGHEQDVLSVAFSPNGKELMAGSNDGKLIIWRIANVKRRIMLKRLFGYFRCVTFSPDGETIAAGSDDGTVILWRRETIAAGSDDGMVILWRPGPRMHVLQKHRGNILSVAFSPNGKLLASSSDDRTVALWNVEDGQYLRTLRGHTGHVVNVAFGLDGATMASVSSEGIVRLWDTSTGRHQVTFFGHLDGWVAFRRDGRFKTSGDSTGVFWHGVGLCRFEPGELDSYLPSPLRIPEGEPLFQKP
jgi:WD40 repeat protein/nucleoside phosphorylase